MSTLKLKKEKSTSWKGNNMGTDSAEWIVVDYPHIRIVEFSGGGWNAVDRASLKYFVRGARTRSECLEILAEKLKTPAISNDAVVNGVDDSNVVVKAEPTITVKGHFGDKQMTKAQFVKVWTDHMTSVVVLSHEHYEETVAMRQRVGEIAGIEWERLYDANRKVFGVLVGNTLLLSHFKDEVMRKASELVESDGKFSTEVFELANKSEVAGFAKASGLSIEWMEVKI